MTHDGTATSQTPEQAVGSKPRRGRVLAVDDERSILNLLSRWLGGDGHEVVGVGSAKEATLELERSAFDVLIADLILRDGDGLDLLRAARDRWPEMPVVAMSGYATIDSAVEAMKLGAFEYLAKPLRLDQMLRVVRCAIDQQDLLRARRSLRRALDAPYSLDAIVGRTHQMRRVLDLVDAVADSRATVLIRGERGAGKTLVARAIHQRSGRHVRPFIELSCAALPQTLLEAELLGSVKDTLHEAATDREGKLHVADGGTVFLDEVSRAGPSLQAKLLRLLQERQFEPQGSSRTQTVDVRLILATSVDLGQEVAEGRFDHDLYRRINAIRVELPPLRERLTDIPLLAEHFLQKYAHQCGRRIAGFGESAVQAMQRYPWPGNVRELESCIERAVVVARGAQVTRDDLPPAIISAAECDAALFAPGSGRPLTLKQALAEPERRIIQAALEANGWNRQKTAAVLDVNRTTLYKKMKRYGVTDPPQGA